MKLSEIARSCGLKALAQVSDPDISHAYCGDLMSDVMGHACPGSVWVTIQAHRNSIGVAGIKDIPAIIFSNGAEVEPEIIEMARQQEISVFSSPLDSFTLCGELYALGLKGGGV